MKCQNEILFSQMPKYIIIYLPDKIGTGNPIIRGKGLLTTVLEGLVNVVKKRGYRRKKLIDR